MSRWYALAQTALGFSLFLSGEPGAAEPLRKAIMSEASVPLARIMALSVASLVATEEGRIAQARELASAAQRLWRTTAISAALRSIPSPTRPSARFTCWRGGSGKLAPSSSVRSGHAGVWPGLSPWPTLENLLRLASLLLDIGDRAEAAALLDEARNILTSLPDGAEAQLVQARRARTTDRDEAVAGRFHLRITLTEREVAVLHLLAGNALAPRDRAGAAPVAEHDQDPRPGDLP